MLVWWAVFFFAGTLFPSGASGAAAALAASSILGFLYSRRYPGLWPRIFLTCSSGLVIMLSASLTPFDRDVLSGAAGTQVRRHVDHSLPVSIVRERIFSITGARALDGDTRGLMRALLIADRKAVSKEARRYWSATGTAHYLALSGLHLGLIALPVFGVLAIAGARGAFRDIAGIFILSFYAAVAGTPGSLLRALSMLAVLRMSRLAGVRTGLSQCVISGAFLVCVIDRRSLGDIGFLLSFNAASGVALIGMPVCESIRSRIAGKGWIRLLQLPVLSLAMSLCVQLSMLVLSVRIFGIAPLAGPVMSVILALPVTVFLYCGFIYVIAGHILGPAAAAPLNLISWITTGLVKHGAEAACPGVLISDFDTRLYLPALLLCALGLRWDERRRSLVTAGVILAVASFHPVIHLRDAGTAGPVLYSRHGARLYGGDAGILVLDHWPSEWSAAYLVRDVRRSGVRGAGSIVILDPGDFEETGISLITRDLDIEHVFFSPWFEGYPRGTGWQAITEDTVISGGSVSLSVIAPALLPGRGICADEGEASLAISPLD